MKTLVAMNQHQGGREYQQDMMTINPNVHPDELCTVADGMGGYEGGEIASSLIVNRFRDMTIDGDDMGVMLKHTLDVANQDIAEYKETHPEVKSMGSTLVSAYFTESSIQWISVGDSLLYRTECYDKIERINENHSIAGLLDLQLKQGEITQKDVDENPNKHMLTSAMTGEEIATVDLSNSKIRKKNHIFILASDGLETLSEEEILATLKQFDCGRQEGLNGAAQALIDAVLAKKKRNQDNVTVLLVSSDELQCEKANAASKIKAKRNQKEEKKSFSINLKIISIFIVTLIILGLLVWQIFGGSTKEEVLVDTNSEKNVVVDVDIVGEKSSTTIQQVDTDDTKKNNTALATPHLGAKDKEKEAPNATVIEETTKNPKKDDQKNVDEKSKGAKKIGPSIDQNTSHPEKDEISGSEQSDTPKNTRDTQSECEKDNAC